MFQAKSICGRRARGDAAAALIPQEQIAHAVYNPVDAVADIHRHTDARNAVLNKIVQTVSKYYTKRGAKSSQCDKKKKNWISKLKSTHYEE